MAKIAPRRVRLDNPEEMLNLAQSLWEKVRPYAKFLVWAGILILVGLAAWRISSRMEASRERQAAEALLKVQPKAGPGAVAEAPSLPALDKVIKDWSGTKAAREAELLRANLLYREQKYAEAAKAYKALLRGIDPSWDALVNESLSYCYEAMGDFKKAAQTLKAAQEQASGPWRGEMMRRLALLYDRAKEPKEAATYWRKLLEQPADPALVPYFKEKLAASEAQIKK